MQNPLNMKETWAWIWKAVQDVYAFMLKPFAAFMIVIVAVVVCWYISDQKYDNGYQAGIKNQKSSDSINVTYQEKTIKSLESERDYYKQKSDSMDCAEETRKAVAYINNVTGILSKKEIVPKAQKINEVSKYNKSLEKEISKYEKLLPKNKKQ